MADLNSAKKTLEEYDDLLEFVKYCTQVMNVCLLLGNKMHMHNPTQPLAIYRQSSASSFGANFADINLLLKAYYSMVDELQDNPVWQRKVSVLW